MGDGFMDVFYLLQHDNDIVLTVRILILQFVNFMTGKTKMQNGKHGSRIRLARFLSPCCISPRTNSKSNWVWLLMWVEFPSFLNLKKSLKKFQWREKFYEQTHGAPMGSPLSPVMANLFMEEFEKKALATSTLKPGFWFRYVDDTLSSWAHGLENLHRFLEHINSLHPSIKFTYRNAEGR